MRGFLAAEPTSSLIGPGPTREQRKLWDELGFVVVESALHDFQVRSLRREFEQRLPEAPRRARARDQVDLPDAASIQCFKDLVEHRSWNGLVRSFLGGSVARLTQRGGLQARFLPHFSGRDYPSWHAEFDRDAPTLSDAVKPPEVKVIIYVCDVDDGNRPFSVVARSHRVGFGAAMAALRDAAGDDRGSLPGHTRIVGPAGTAVVFNPFIWQTEMPGKANRGRMSVLLSYVRNGDK